MRICITSPIYVSNFLHQQFVNYTTKSIVSKENQLVFVPVENHLAKGFIPFEYILNPNIELVKTPGNHLQSVSSGWNIGIGKGIELGCEYILVINDDIILKSNAIDRLVSFAEKYKDSPEYVMWTMGQYASPPERHIDSNDYFAVVADLEQCGEDENVSEHPNFSAYMVRNNFQDEMGLFDENIRPGYYEDNDMHARIALANKKAVVYGGARFFHFGSRTINSDMTFREEMPPLFRANEAYFISKWGTKNVGEVEEMRRIYWKHPYNEEDKPLSYWRGQ